MENHPVDPQVRQAIDAFARAIGNDYDIEKMVLFGSRARGTNRPDSDIDVAVILRGEQLPFLETKQAMSAAARAALGDSALAISPLPIWHDEWSGATPVSDLSLLDRIRREGITL